jgi:hypothetical protein
MGDTELKPAPKLSGPQLEAVSEAIVDAFDIRELTQALRFKWGITLGTMSIRTRAFTALLAI